MRAAKPFAALLVSAALIGVPVSSGAGTEAPVSRPIRLVNVAGFEHWYIRAVKARVQRSFADGAQPIRFARHGSRIYLATLGQRLQWHGTVVPWYVRHGCYRSDRPPSPDADVTTTFTVHGDATVIARTVRQLLAGNCPY